jgi:hypothetical protein
MKKTPVFYGLLFFIFKNYSCFRPQNATAPGPFGTPARGKFGSNDPFHAKTTSSRYDLKSFYISVLMMNSIFNFVVAGVPSFGPVPDNFFPMRGRHFWSGRSRRSTGGGGGGGFRYG